MDGEKRSLKLDRPLLQGKVPNEVLEKFLGKIPSDPSVLIPPRVGEDSAAVDIEDEEVLILKSDPITFASDSVGYYTVLINANDIACSGARPRWLLTTLLLPPGTSGNRVLDIMEELNTVCCKWNITLCGGHSELTDAVNRPVVIGMLAGTVTRKKLLDKRSMKRSDRILLTKRVAVEGTALIAREFADLLKNRGWIQEDIDRCRDFLDRLSILEEAEIAAGHEGVTAMHDITEGGLSTALSELGIAGGHKIRVNVESVPIFPETRKICDTVGLDPVGLIGSGSLLICCAPATTDGLIEKITGSGIEVACIGEVLEPGTGIEAFNEDVPVDWPRFDTDEITRLFTLNTG